MNDRLRKISLLLTDWIGTPMSVLLHTIFFAASFTLPFFGADLSDVLLALTTVVSLEAIYLAIFIQMTVNRHSEHLEEVGADIEDIQEEVQDLGEDVEEISEDIEKIQEDQSGEETEDAKTQTALFEIQTTLRRLLMEIEGFKGKDREHHPKIAASPDEEHQKSAVSEPERNESHYFRKILNFISPKGKSEEENPKN